MSQTFTACKRLSFICMALLLLVHVVGCTNGYREFFTSAVMKPHPSLAEYDRHNLVAFEGEPRIITQYFDDSLGRRLVEDGFVLIGHSTFNGPPQGERALISFAKSIGAEIVITASQYSHTVSGAVPFTTYSPQTIQTSGTVYTNTGSWATYSGTATGTTARTTYVPYSIARYDQTASYWTRSARPRVFGAQVTEMSDIDRQNVGRNTGVRVVACVRDSPAWRADVLPGDYILAVDSRNVDSSQQLYDVVSAAAGGIVNIEVLRGSELRKISVQLNPDPMRSDASSGK